jgi:hypothetical protein
MRLILTRRFGHSGITKPGALAAAQVAPLTNIPGTDRRFHADGSDGLTESSSPSAERCHRQFPHPRTSVTPLSILL